MRASLVRVPIAVLLLMTLFVPSVAQDDDSAGPHPLIEILDRVPDTDIARDGIVTYVDYPAIFTAPGGLGAPTNFAAFETALDMLGPPVMSSLQRILTEPALQYLMQYESMPDVVGFDFFQIQRATTFGRIPEQGVIFDIDYDADAVVAAHLAREFTEETINGIPVLCGPAGCDSGMELDPANREIENIFDASGLGRRPPVLLGDGYLSSAFALEIAESLAATATGDTPSLAESDDYGLLANTLVDLSAGLDEDGGALLQLQIFPADLLAATAISLPPEVIEDIIERLGDSRLAPYSLVAFADMQADFDKQVGVLAIVTNSVVEAELAASVLAERVPAFTSLSRGSGEPLFDRLASFEIESGYVGGEDTDNAIAYVIVRYPPTEPENASSTPITGQVFRWWIQAIQFGEYYPLWNVIDF